MTYIIDLRDKTAASSGPEESALLFHEKFFQKLVSVIIVAPAELNLLIKALAAITTQQGFVREIIIVNSHTDEKIKRYLYDFMQQYLKTYVVTCKKNIGLAQAYNLGAQYASGQYTLFLQAYYPLQPYAITRLMLVAKEEKSQAWIITLHDTAAQARLWQQHFLKNALPEDPAKHHHHSHHINEHCFFMATDLFNELQGLDKACFHSSFQYDLALRLHLKGGNIYQREQLVDLQPSLQAPPSSLRKSWQAFKGWQHFYQKYAQHTTTSIEKLAFYSVLILSSLKDFCWARLGQLTAKR